jgi:hypothetical protein
MESLEHCLMTIPFQSSFQKPFFGDKQGKASADGQSCANGNDFEYQGPADHHSSTIWKL